MIGPRLSRSLALTARVDIKRRAASGEGQRKRRGRMGTASLKRYVLFLPSSSSPFSVARTRARLPVPSLLSCLLLQSRKTRPSSFSRALCSSSSSSSSSSSPPSPHSPPRSTAYASGMAPIPAGSKPSAELYLYNTMTKQKELFRPRVPGKVGMYVCGVTAYDLSHIGHARVYVTFDVLYRYLQYLKYEVCYVRNFTDVDDKIIVRANELGEDPLTLSSRYCNEFLTDMASLQCLPPSVEPRVSDHMGQIIDMIKKSVFYDRSECLAFNLIREVILHLSNHYVSTQSKCKGH